MKLTRLNGHHLFHAFCHGTREVFKRREHLNEINVFPVPDGDTGTNLSMTLQSLCGNSEKSDSASVMGENLARAALRGSRGNSGIIFAQFVRGFSEGVKGRENISQSDFVLAASRGVDRAYQALSKPVEGTIVTVMKAWVNGLHHYHEKASDFHDLMSKSIQSARTALQETTQKLEILRKAGVVDAGALGFVHFLEGIRNFLSHGRHADINMSTFAAVPDESSHSFDVEDSIEHRYCTEVWVSGENLESEAIRTRIDTMGDSVLVAGGGPECKIHIHTNHPDEVVAELASFGRVGAQKVDDMVRQYEDLHDRRSSIALVTDSACDLPQEILDRYQIHLVPLSIAFGDDQYLDKVTLRPNRFYDMLDHDRQFPKSSQPSVQAFITLYKSLLARYDHVLSVHLSSGLSGTCNAAMQAAREVDARRISVLDSRQLSSSLGLIVLDLASRIAEGETVERLIKTMTVLPGRARILVSVPSLKSMVRGGRVSPLKGMLARLLNLKPIVSLDEKGRSALHGKAFSYRANIRKILRMIERDHRERGVERFAVGHAHARDEAVKLGAAVADIVGFKAEYVMDISPIIGAHAGAGAVSVSYLMKENESVSLVPAEKR